MKLKITQVDALRSTRLRITWENGKRTEVDTADYLQVPGYERLRDPAFFASVQVEEWGHGVEWPTADIGIPADALYRLPKGTDGRCVSDRAVQCLDEASRFVIVGRCSGLHLTRRTIIYYRTGGQANPGLHRARLQRQGSGTSNSRGVNLPQSSLYMWRTQRSLLHHHHLL